MSNWSEYGVVSHARYALECPLCNKARGQVLITERCQTANSYGGLLHMECKTCGELGQTEIAWDWAVPAGTRMSEHGRDAAEILTVWLMDHPPSAVVQLAAIARRIGPENDDS